MTDLEITLEAIRESMPELFPWMPWAHDNYTRGEVRDWIKRSNDSWKNGSAREFAIFDTVDGTYLGGCGLNHIDYENRMANLGYWVRTSRAGSGVAATVARLLADFCFRELSLTRLEILVAVENLRSQRVAAKVGALREGVLRKRFVVRGTALDCVMFSLVPEDMERST
jgi:RimJ/RimL family protein N-acetyltransferase